jgi:hypothetical protein
MLLLLGVDSFLVEMSIPFVWFTPGTVDPDSQSVIEIIKAMQRGFQKLGYKQVKVNGILDRQTAAALDQVSGPPGMWMEKSLVQILGDIVNAMRNPDRTAHKMNALGGYFDYQGVPPGPLPGPMVGLPPGPMGMDGVLDFFSQSSGLAGKDPVLTFGQGIKNKNIIVPIPKKSGPTFGAFKDLQRQINRLLSRHPRKGRIDEDGVIGNDTFSGLQKAQEVFGQNIAHDESTLEMAKNARSVAAKLRSEADAMGIAANANLSSVTQSVSRRAVSEPTPPPMTERQAAAFTSGAMGAVKKYVPFLLLAGGIAYFATKKKGTKRRAS